MPLKGSCEVPQANIDAAGKNNQGVPALRNIIIRDPHLQDFNSRTLLFRGDLLAGGQVFALERLPSDSAPDLQEVAAMALKGFLGC